MTRSYDLPDDEKVLAYTATGPVTLEDLLNQLRAEATARRATLAEAKVLARFESELSDSNGRRVQYHNGPDAGHGYPR